MADDLNTFMSNRPNTYRTALYYIASPYSHNDPKIIEIPTLFWRDTPFVHADSRLNR